MRRLRWFWALSNLTGLGQDGLSLTSLHPATPKRTTHHPVSSTRRVQPAFPLWHPRHGISAFPMKMMYRRLLLAISIRIGCPRAREHPRDYSGNNHPAESVAKPSSACTINLERNLQLLTSRTSRDCKSYPGSEEGKTSRSPGSLRFSRKE